MAYMHADTSAKVGFRPYHQTDPFGAAHLSGMAESVELGEYHLNRPFDPWELYADVHDTAGLHGVDGGLGQNHPFKPTAWQLHGLGAGVDVTSEAVQELVSSGHISSDQGNLILDGSLSFTDLLGYDPTDQSSWLNAADMLRTWNQELQALEQQATQVTQDNLHSGAQPSAAWQQFTSGLNGQRQQFESVATRFVDLYRTVMGSVPAGLSGLGIVPVAAWIAGAAVGIVAVYFGYQYFKAWREQNSIDQAKAQTAQTQAVTDAQLAKEIQDAQAKGDTITANSLIALLKQRAASSGGGGAPADLSSWFMTNAKWLGLGLGGLIVLGPLSSGLFGGRRR